MELDQGAAADASFAIGGRDARDTSAETDTSSVFIGYE